MRVRCYPAISVRGHDENDKDWIDNFENERVYNSKRHMIKEEPFMFDGKMVDLSQEIYQGMPVYPGHLKTVIWTHLSHEECQRMLGTGFSYETRGIMFCDHGPTHIDAVSHLSRDPGAESIEQLALEKCITSAICLDVSDNPQKTQFGREKIAAELAKWDLEIRAGDTVLVKGSRGMEMEKIVTKIKSGLLNYSSEGC